MPTLTHKTFQQPAHTPRQNSRRWWRLAAGSLTAFMGYLESSATDVTWQQPGALAAGNPAALLARWR
jgi:hypothetical protein